MYVMYILRLYHSNCPNRTVQSVISYAKNTYHTAKIFHWTLWKIFGQNQHFKGCIGEFLWYKEYTAPLPKTQGRLALKRVVLNKTIATEKWNRFLLWIFVSSRQLTQSNFENTTKLAKFLWWKFKFGSFSEAEAYEKHDNGESFH